MTVAVETLLEEQAELLQRGDVAGLTARYCVDAQIIHGAGVARGRAEIAAAFAAQFQSHPRYESIVEVGRGEDCVNYRATILVDGGRIDVAGTFIVRDGEIWRHTTIVTGGD